MTDKEFDAYVEKYGLQKAIDDNPSYFPDNVKRPWLDSLPDKEKKKTLKKMSSVRIASELLKIANSILAGCEKLPEGGMRDNCEKKKAEGEKNSEKKEAANKSRTKEAASHVKIDDLIEAEPWVGGLLKVLATTHPIFRHPVRAFSGIHGNIIDFKGDGSVFNPIALSKLGRIHGVRWYDLGERPSVGIEGEWIG